MSIFSKVQTKKPNSNIFDLSHDRKFSFEMGRCTPILCMDVVPGDKITCNTGQLIRFAPMVAPMMHQVSVYTHFFFVPNRIVWPNWEDFITGGEDGLDTSVFPTTTVEEGYSETGTLPDYMGIPLSSGVDVTDISAIPFSAYQLIWHEYYRDQNLQPSVGTYDWAPLVDGPNSYLDLMILRNRSWQHDYFTSALPFAQKGPEATIPLGTSADIKFNTDDGFVGDKMFKGSSILVNTDSLGKVKSGDGGWANQTVPSELWSIDNSHNLQADLSTATAATINDLRRAFKLQEWLEKNARGGSRYTESILSHFGVKSSDARLNRPEFLGGGSSPLVVSEVLQTSETPVSGTPQGNMAGHGISVGSHHGFSKFCEEHGYIIGIMTVMPKTAYWQGMPKHFKKFDKFDYYWPSFAHLGEQPVEKGEVYYDETDGQNSATFGYTPRYAEYKYMNSSVHGDFRTSLDFWHLGRKFASRPSLNGAFIECVPDKRIFAVTDPNIDSLWGHVYHNIKASRRMPYFGTPSF